MTKDPKLESWLRNLRGEGRSRHNFPRKNLYLGQVFLLSGLAPRLPRLATRREPTNKIAVPTTRKRKWVFLTSRSPSPEASVLYRAARGLLPVYPPLSSGAPLYSPF